MTLSDCRVSRAPLYMGKKWYCAACGQSFDDLEHRPCETPQLLREETPAEPADGGKTE